LWSLSEDSASRRVLDSRKSNSAPNISGTGTLDEDFHPWPRLAERFNDYAEFTPQNRLLLYNDVNGKPELKTPWAARSSDVQCLAAHCYQLNPTDMSRSKIYRDGTWIKENWMHLKSWTTAILADFNRSGQNKGKELADLDWLSAENSQRWIYHAQSSNRRYPTVTAYSYAVFEWNELIAIGRQLEPGVGRDQSLDQGPEKVLSFNTNMNEKRRKRKRNKAGEDSQSKRKDDRMNLAAAISNATADENFDRQMDILMRNAPTPELKEQTWKKYFEMVMKNNDSNSNNFASPPSLHREEQPPRIPSFSNGGGAVSSSRSVNNATIPDSSICSSSNHMLSHDEVIDCYYSEIDD